MAEAELEYNDNHVVNAAYVKFPIQSLPFEAVKHPDVTSDRLFALIWTTTPWTLPANVAIGIHKDQQYSIVQFSNTPEQYIIADALIDSVKAHLPQGTAAKTLLSFRGATLVDGASYINILSGKHSQFVHADFVTTTSGTGLVHFAPGHGLDDYHVLTALGYRDIPAPVDNNGRFTSDAFPHSPELLTGLAVETEGARAVFNLLSNADSASLPIDRRPTESFVFAAHRYEHKSPIDWRTKQLVIVRATEQWFANVGSITDSACTALDNVKFTPSHHAQKLASHVRGRQQWCISRQRAWGVPIPALFDGERAVMTTESIDHIISVLSERGTDAWWTDPVDDPAWISPSLPAGQYARGKDTMDVWFDSGTSWTEVSNDTHVQHTVVEGTDQHRGWFQSSLLTHIAQQQSEVNMPVAPYDHVITHGFVLDQYGRKMSKSLGNVISPSQILDGTVSAKSHGEAKPDNKTKVQSKGAATLGPDVLHLWVASNDYTKDISLGPALLQTVHQSLQKYRVTFKWLLGVLQDYPHAEPSADLLVDPPSFADWTALHRLGRTSVACFEAQNEYAFHQAVSSIYQFINHDLSATYFEVIKDRLYAGSEETRMHTQTVLFIIVNNLLDMLAPITPLLVQEVWEHMPDTLKGDNESPLKRVWDAPFTASFGDFTSQDMDQHISSVAGLASAIKGAQERARRENGLGSGLACSVEIQLPSNAPEHFGEILGRLEEQDELKDIFVVSEVQVVPADETLRRTIEDAAEDREVREYFAQRRKWRSNVAWTQEATYHIDGLHNKDGHACKIVVLPASGLKCPRCWQYTSHEADELCHRCANVLGLANDEKQEEDMFEDDGELPRSSAGGRRRPGRPLRRRAG